MATILVLHGPNLNLLGAREPEVYGKETLAEINIKLQRIAIQQGHVLAIFQSNSESELIDRVQACKKDSTNFIIFNPAGFTHTSVVLRDALLGVAVPFIEVHLSNLSKRESFRHFSYFSDIAIGTISGLGAEGYYFALQYAHTFLTNNFKKIGAETSTWI